jgi:hypothetical protein
MYRTLGARLTWLLVENTTFNYIPAALLPLLHISNAHNCTSLGQLSLYIYVGGFNPFVANAYMSFINSSAGELTLDKFVIDN